MVICRLKPKNVKHVLLNFMLFATFFFSSSCEEAKDGFAALEETAAFIQEPEQPTGNLGIVFDNGKYDFGVAEAYETSTNLAILLTNQAGKNLYLKDIDFGEADAHFSIISNKCPLAPSIFPGGYECEMIISFSPQAPETILTLMAAVYGETEEEFNLKTEVFAQGRGVSPLDFEGATDIDNPSTTTLDVHWSANEDIVSFNVMIALGETPNENDFSLKKSVPNNGGTVSFATIDGLTPDTFYSLKVNAIDLLGNVVVSSDFIVGKTLPNNAPDIDQVNWFTTGLPTKYYTSASAPNFNIRDAATLEDTDIDGDPLKYTCTFSVTNAIATNQDCNTLPNQDGTSAIFSEFKGELNGWIPKNDWVTESITFTIVATDPYNIEDSVTSSAIYIEQGTPETPIFKKICDKDSNLGASGIIDTTACSLTDSSPSPVSTLEIVGKHTTDGTDGGTPVSGDEVFVYSDNTCSNLVGSGISNTAGWFAIQIDLSSGALNQVSDLTIKARNGVGNESACSAVFASYTHDDTPPSILTLDSIYPEGPSFKTDPTISIQSDATTSVGIYEDSTCTTSLATGVTDGLGVYSTSLNLAGKLTATTGQAVPIYLYAEDAAGNSTCSALAHTYYLYQLYTARYTVTQTESLNTVTNPTTAEHLKYTLVNQTGFSLNGTDEIQVPQTGDILLMVNLPVVNTTGQRSATRLYAEVINGTDTVSYRSEFSQSSYVRGLDGHYESSTTLNTLLPNVTAGDYIRIKVEQAGPAGSEQSFDGSAPTTVYLEYLDEVRPYYAAEITGPVDGGDIANFDYMPISSEFTIAEKVKSTSADSLGFSVNSSRAIVLPEASTYLVTLNVPFTSITAMQRCAPQINLRLEGNLVGIARQAYIRGNHSPYHRYSSNHWIGIIESANANEELVFEISKDGSAGDCNDPGELRFNTLNNAGQSADVKGLIYVEKVDTSYGFAQLSSAGVTNGTESVYWNQDRASNYYVNFEAFVNNDSNIFSLNTSTEEITIAETGNYIGGFTAAFQTTSQRGNVKVEALLDGAVVGTTQSAYVRNASSHVYSSTAMSFPFDATASDAMRLRSSAGANGPTDFGSLKLEGSAKFFMWKRD